MLGDLALMLTPVLSPGEQRPPPDCAELRAAVSELREAAATDAARSPGAATPRRGSRPLPADGREPRATADRVARQSAADAPGTDGQPEHRRGDARRCPADTARAKTDAGRAGAGRGLSQGGAARSGRPTALRRGGPGRRPRRHRRGDRHNRRRESGDKVVLPGWRLHVRADHAAPAGGAEQRARLADGDGAADPGRAAHRGDDGDRSTCPSTSPTSSSCRCCSASASPAASTWRCAGASRDRRSLLVTSTPKAVLFSALTTIGSFGSLAISQHPGMASMGLLLTAALIYTTLCTLIVLPALRVVFARPAPRYPH